MVKGPGTEVALLRHNATSSGAFSAQTPSAALDVEREIAIKAHVEARGNQFFVCNDRRG